MNNIRQHFPALVGTVTSSGAAWASWAEHLDRALSIGASAVAITAGIVTIWSLLRKPKSSK